MAEWAPCDASYGERIGHLEHGAGRNGAMVLNDTTVHDDGAEDQLTGSAGRDWFFANRNCGAKDIITDLQAKEGWVDID